MADHPNVDAARASLEAFMKGDVEGFAAGLADDSVWHIPGTHRFAGEFVGKEANLGRFKQMAEAGLKVSIDEIHDVVGGEDHVVALVRTSVSGSSGSASGNAVFVMHVRDGLLREFWAMNERQAEIDAVLGS